MDDCETCKHKKHDAGQCEQCNCGESEIIHSNDQPYVEDEFDGYQISTFYERYEDF